MTPAWPLVEDAAKDGHGLTLTHAMCVQLIDWYNAVIGDKNQVVRDNHSLAAKVNDLRAGLAAGARISQALATQIEELVRARQEEGPTQAQAGGPAPPEAPELPGVS